MSLQNRLYKEKITFYLMLAISVMIGLFLLFIFFGLFIKSFPIIHKISFMKIIFSNEWHPHQNKFGLLSFIVGTGWVTAIALIIAVPLCILASLFLAEFTHKKLQRIALTLIDLLSGIPSVVYGIWGVIVVVPLVKDYIAPLFNISTTGYCILSGGIVLAIMIFPIIIQIYTEILLTVPHELREATLALGATKWETVKLVVFRKTIPGLIASIILGASRALGETMAVMMVVGNVAQIPKNVFEAGYPMTALIANNYGEMLTIPLYDSAIMLAALILLLIVLIFNLMGRLVLNKIERSFK